MLLETRKRAPNHSIGSPGNILTGTPPDDLFKRCKNTMVSGQDFPNNIFPLVRGGVRGGVVISFFSGITSLKCRTYKRICSISTSVLIYVLVCSDACAGVLANIISLSCYGCRQFHARLEKQSFCHIEQNNDRHQKVQTPKITSYLLQVFANYFYYCWCKYRCYLLATICSSSTF